MGRAFSRSTFERTSFERPTPTCTAATYLIISLVSRTVSGGLGFRVSGKLAAFVALARLACASLHTLSPKSHFTLYSTLNTRHQTPNTHTTHSTLHSKHSILVARAQLACTSPRFPLNPILSFPTLGVLDNLDKKGEADPGPAGVCQVSKPQPYPKF